jgi:LuxR family transcriptional regulator, maltose regulon positive regulatory protein
MSSDLLHTKLYMPPARPDLVVRPRLTSRLTEGLSRPLTLIAAPAGFGKTTLLAEWRATPQGRDYPLGWLSLDPDDSDPPRFWAYVVAALRALPAFAGAESFGQATLELLHTVPGITPRHYLPPLLNELTAAPGPFALVLDDYHAIESPAVHEAVQFLLDHQPARMHLVVLTRADPPWPLARLRSQGLLAEFRAADLRFTDDEAAAFLSHALDGAVPAEDVAALQQRTEGWVAALQMAALSLAGQNGPADRHAFVTSFAGEHRYVADYLAEEVISRQPEPVQEFLMRTAILERMTAPLCAAVTGQDDAGALLEQIDRANLFLVPLDDERRWFRYHHLFADLLRAWLRRIRPDLVHALCQRASQWHETAGHPIPAVTYALAGEDHDRAARLVEQNVHDWWGLASSDFLRLMARLPAPVIRTRPTLAVYQAWIGIVTGHLDAAAALIEAAESQLGSAPAAGQDDPLAAMRSFVALMRTYCMDLTGQPYALSASVLEAPGQIPEAYVAMRNSADVVLAFILQMNGDLDRAAALLADAARRDLAAGLTNAVPIAISRLARIRMVQGRLPEAAEVCRHHLNLIAGPGAGRHFVTGSLNTALADVLREQNDLAGAEAQAREAVAQNEAWEVPDARGSAFLVLARVLLARGDAGGAAEGLARAEAAGRGRTIMTDLAGLHRSVQVRLWLHQGDVAAARQWADARGLSAGDPPSFRQEPDHLTLTRILLAEGRRTEAQTLLARLAPAAAAGGRTGRLIEILALQALALRQHDPERALGSLEHALVLAEPAGYVRTFLDEGRPMAELLRQLTGRSGPAQAYAVRLLAALAGGPGSGPAAAGGPEALLEPLTDRELEVMRLLTAGLSNQEMAGRLMVSVGTVKTHVHNIYGKLGAAGRVRAIARARELRLI